jgi:hypothetical protein
MRERVASSPPAHRIDSAASWWARPIHQLSVAISYAGLEALGVPRDSLESFPEAFSRGDGGRFVRDNSATRASATEAAGIRRLAREASISD